MQPQVKRCKPVPLHSWSTSPLVARPASRVAKMAAPLAMGRDLGQVVTNTAAQPARMPTLATHHQRAVLSFYALNPT